MSTIFVNPEDQALVKARHEAFIAAFNDGADVDRVMSFFSPELSYSDYSNYLPSFLTSIHPYHLPLVSFCHVAN